MNGRRVLIVDDSAVNRDVYGLVLEHFGYTVLKAVDGRDGVRQARDLRPDLILMDVCMPVLDGIEATERLKADASTRHIPVIGLSALDDALTIGRAYAVGMEGYLPKPAMPRQVIREIERCLNGSDADATDDAVPSVVSCQRAADMD